MDADSGKVVDDIPDTDGVHGIALADDLNLGFEKTLELNPDRDAVLISAESIHALKKAYPNYFADTSDFSRNLEKILKVNNNLLQSK